MHFKNGSGVLLITMSFCFNSFFSGYFVSTISPTVAAASALSAPLILPLLLLGGFYVNNK